MENDVFLLLGWLQRHVTATAPLRARRLTWLMLQTVAVLAAPLGNRVALAQSSPLFEAKWTPKNPVVASMPAKVGFNAHRPPKAGAGLPANVQKLDGKAEEAMRKKAGKALQEAQSTLRFEQNRGQLANSAVLYTAKDEQATHFFTKSEVRSVITGKMDSLQAGYALQFLGANPDVAVTAANRFDAKSGAINYITGQGSFGDVAAYRKIAYGSLWQGIDAEFYESEGSMKYDFIVQPNADPAQVRLKLDGATDLKVNAKGELEFTTPFGMLQKGKPYTYQTIHGKRVEVAAAYVLNDGAVSFQLGNYDHRLPLIIDPIALKWSTYLMPGTNGFQAINVHPGTGRIYLTGSALGASFPNTLGRTYAGSNDVFVTCMEKDGTTLVWSTYIGGTDSDSPLGLTVDAAGDIYVGGYTASSDFPVNGTTAAYDATYNGNGDMFLLRLNSTGATLKYSTFIGGSAYESVIVSELVVTNGKAYFGGSVESTDFPTTAGAYQTTKTSPGGYFSAVFLGVNTNVGGSAGLELSTFFSAGQATSYSEFTTGSGTVEDKDGNIWLAGFTKFEPLFPISANAVQKYADFATSYLSNVYVNFVVKFSKSGQYLYSSYVNPLYSATNSWGSSYSVNLDVDAQGNVYVAARTKLTATTPATVKKANNIANFYELAPLGSMNQSGNLLVGFLAKIPYNLSPQYDFVSIFPVGTQNRDPKVAVDKKGNIHLLTQAIVLSGSNFPLTAGAFNTNLVSGSTIPIYYVLAPSGGSVLYGTVVRPGDNSSNYDMDINDKCEAYLVTGAATLLWDIR